MQVGRKKFHLHKILHHMAVSQLPFLSVCLYPVPILLISYEVAHFMDQCDEECVLIQISVHADAVMIDAGSMTIIPQYAFSCARNRKMNFVPVQVLEHLFTSPGRHIMVQIFK